MTCIVGYRDRSGVIIGADSAGTEDSGHQDLFKNPKVFQSGSFIIGYTDSFRTGQILQHCIDFPEPDGQATHAFMVKEFVLALKRGLKEYGWLGEYDSRDTMGGNIMVGHDRKLYIIDSEFSVLESIRPYATLGAGMWIARGAFSALEKVYTTEPLSSLTKCQLALDAATDHMGSVKGPYTFQTTKL